MIPATSLDQLRATRALITDPEHFTTGAMARDHRGRSCPAHAPRACAWCAAGAWERVTGTYFWRLGRLCGVTSPTIVNDEEGHAVVLTMLDGAIARQLEIGEAS